MVDPLQAVRLGHRVDSEWSSPLQAVRLGHQKDSEWSSPLQTVRLSHRKDSTYPPPLSKTVGMVGKIGLYRLRQETPWSEFQSYTVLFWPFLGVLPSYFQHFYSILLHFTVKNHENKTVGMRCTVLDKNQYARKNQVIPS